MNKLIFLFTVLFLITGCDDAKKVGNETAREITGANMIEQGKRTQQQLKAIDQQQQARFKQLDQQ
jgi:hypothetical protein